MGTASGKAMGTAAILMGKLAIKLGQTAVGGNGQQVMMSRTPPGNERKSEENERKKELEREIEKKERNYKREAETEKARYKQINIKVDREFAAQLMGWLAERHMTMADWFRACAEASMQSGIRDDISD